MSRGTIIFDFDGTIADSAALVLELFYELTGHERLTEDEIVGLRRLPVLKVLKKLHVSMRHIPRFIVKGRGLMERRMNEVKVFPGIPETIAILHIDGWQLMVMSTNSQYNVKAYLQTHGMSEYFDKIYGNVGLFSKTQALRKVIRHNKLDRSTCFYVGDEVRDMQAARRARVRPVAVTWGYNDISILSTERPIAIAKTPAELVTTFKTMPEK